MSPHPPSTRLPGPAPTPHPARPRRRGGAIVLTVATFLGIWFGMTAPKVSPIAPPAPAPQTQAAMAPGQAPP